MEFALAALPYLFFLACPLMMVACMVGMRKMGCSPSSAGSQDTAAQPREARVAALEGQLAMIQAELQALRTADDAPAASGPRLRADRAHVDAQPEIDRAARKPA